MDTTIVNREGVLKDNRALTDRLFSMTIEVPDIAQALLPGQFIHVLIPGMEGHILRRPFSVYRCDGKASTLTVLYQVVGYGTEHLTRLGVGTFLNVLGPIGRPWRAPENTHRALLVSGGVGAAPLYLHAADLMKRGVDVEMVMGSQSESSLVCRKDYSSLLGTEPLCATDDGSYGHAGFCTDLVKKRIDEAPFDYVACCGPEPMMRIVSSLALDAGIVTEVSLERRMACGIGACLSCVVSTKQGNRRACVDGPIFDADEVIWE